MMFGTGLIVFRETLEAALFIGLLAAATTGLRHRAGWLSIGVVSGIVGSLLLASVFAHISAWADGMGQELVSAIIFGCALLMLAWHSIWGTRHARELTLNAKDLGSRVADGSSTLWAVAIAVALVVLREGAETVLFVTGITSGNADIRDVIAGILAGVLSGTGVGTLLYLGLGRLRPKHLFAVTHGFILLLAGSFASQLARTLNQAGWAPWFSSTAWDTSDFLPSNSTLGSILHGVTGYDSSPSVLQVIFYVLSIVLIHLASRHVQTQGATEK